MLSERILVKEKEPLTLNFEYVMSREEIAAEVAQLEADNAALQQCILAMENYQACLPENVSVTEYVAQLEAKIEARDIEIDAMNKQAGNLEAGIAWMREVLTRNGKLNWYHIETWANLIEAQQRYQSSLTKWLFSISKAMKALEGGDDGDDAE